MQDAHPLPMPLWGKLAFGAVVVQGGLAALFAANTGLSASEKVLLGAACLLYVALALSDRARERLGSTRYFALQHGLALALPWLGAARTAMCGLAIISQTGLATSPTRTLLAALPHAVNVAAACIVLLPGDLGEQLLYSFFVAVVFVMAFTHAVASELRTRVRLDAATRELTAHAAQAEELATLKERSRIARELHDSLGHTLTAAHVHLLLADRELSAHGDVARTALQTAQRVVRMGLEDLRHTVRALHAPALAGQSFDAALARLVKDHHAPPLSAAFRSTGGARELPPHVTLALYRVAQEALTNVVKHAQATQVDVELAYDAGSVCLRVRDNGRGLPVDVADGFGLSGVRSRARALGASLTLESRAGLALSLSVQTQS
ncbi:MAG: hypothetical protein RL385_237 [Pseudomonadota bacterium]|jgi:signal transduction histidine kinase